MKKWIITAFLLVAYSAFAAPEDQDLLVKFSPKDLVKMKALAAAFSTQGRQAEILGNEWVHIQVSGKRAALTLAALSADPSVQYVQPNYKIKLRESYQIKDPARRETFLRDLNLQGMTTTALPYPDNPPIPNGIKQGTGPDPDFSKQWGMIDLGVKTAWEKTAGSQDVVVAVIDSGIDYTHEDLPPNLWRNAKEISDNGIDDDGNGYIDDIMGWDFASNDNKPYDLIVDPIQLVSEEGGNAGHGTHCAGTVAAKGENALGISGVAPNVKIMALRFINEKGRGTTADAVKAIKYAVDNGAKVLSNSWGGEGEDPAEAINNRALRDAITYAGDHGVLFIAAAGNGRDGMGFDNDSDPNPAFPASYDHENIISVTAIGGFDNLAAFSNWGAKTVDIAAPGINIYSTTVGNKYSDRVFGSSSSAPSWSGSSMATPHVAGAAALYWSANTDKTWREVKEAILSSAKKVPAMMGVSVSEGKLDVADLLGK